MIELTPDESRVLGVLVEKGLTTPDQYPLTLNAVVNGANQKSNRDPVRVDAVGSRTNRYRHNANDALRVRTGELAVLAELLLRGPQTLGELRGRASRMHPFESLDDVRHMLRALAEREHPMVRDLPPAPGSRAERYAQLLCPDLHPLNISEGAERAATAAAGVVSSAGGGAGALAERVAALEADVATLRNALRRLAAAVGEPDPLGGSGTSDAESQGASPA